MRFIVADLVQSAAPIGLFWSADVAVNMRFAESRVPAHPCKMFYGGLGDVAG